MGVGGVGVMWVWEGSVKSFGSGEAVGCLSHTYLFSAFVFLFEAKLWHGLDVCVTQRWLEKERKALSK